MKKTLLVGVIAIVFSACGSGNGNPAESDTSANVTSTTPPPKPDTNTIGIMMGDTSVGLNDSLNKDTLKK